MDGSGSTSSWTSGVIDSIQATAGDVTLVMLGVLTIGLGIFGLQWGVRKAIKFFKSSTN